MFYTASMIATSLILGLAFTTALPWIAASAVLVGLGLAVDCGK